VQLHSTRSHDAQLPFATVGTAGWAREHARTRADRCVPVAPIGTEGLDSPAAMAAPAEVVVRERFCRAREIAAVGIRGGMV
jgi:hypothetical protein